MGETFYEVLGVDPDATQAEITDAYRQRVLETHPDHNDDPDAVEAFKRVDAAETVLADESERARYDRLGHDEYVRLEEGFRTSEDGAADDESGRATEQSTPSAAADARGWSDGATGFESASTSESQSRSHSQSDGSSHHARQRHRREQRTAAAGGTAAEWWVRDEDPDAWNGAEAEREEADHGEEEAGFSYSVHGWDDEVELERDDPSLDSSTRVVVACVALLYPVLVYASVATQFPVVVNAVVAGCTLALVGYLLTMPKIALGAFGCWSLVVPLALPRILGIDPFSSAGLLIVGAFWIPFGYATAVWWALRP